MTGPNPGIQKIEETIRNLQNLKAQGLLPAEQADASIAALQSQLATFSAKLEGDGAIAQGTGAKALGQGAGGIMIEGGVTGDKNSFGSTEKAKKK